uniref:Uncharacterized protein n=1 Tax=Anguilla anguilla TaxID=7936 RepID=A0A0E9TTY2_ANGAN
MYLFIYLYICVSTASHLVGTF